MVRLRTGLLGPLKVRFFGRFRIMCRLADNSGSDTYGGRTMGASLGGAKPNRINSSSAVLAAREVFLIRHLAAGLERAPDTASLVAACAAIESFLNSAWPEADEGTRPVAAAAVPTAGAGATSVRSGSYNKATASSPGALTSAALAACGAMNAARLEAAFAAVLDSRLHTLLLARMLQPLPASIPAQKPHGDYPRGADASVVPTATGSPSAIDSGSGSDSGSASGTGIDSADAAGAAGVVAACRAFVALLHRFGTQCIGGCIRPLDLRLLPPSLSLASAAFSNRASSLTRAAYCCGLLRSGRMMKM
jgi:hypothetical protein